MSSLSRVRIALPQASALRYAAFPTIRQLPRARFTSTTAEAIAATAAPASTPKQPSFFRRAASFAARAALFTTLGFLMAAAPAREAVSQILSPPSDADTLELWHATTAEELEKEAFINTHPLVIHMRSLPDFTENRPHMKIPPAWRKQNFTGGTLSGPGKVVIPPYAWSEKGGKSYVQITHVGTDMCGHVGIVHGGFLATMLDEGLARCCFAALPHNIGMTANLNIDYLKPAHADSYLVLKAKTTKVEGRKAWVEGHLETLVGEGETPVVVAKANALFISPKQAATMSIVYPVT